MPMQSFFVYRLPNSDDAFAHLGPINVGTVQAFDIIKAQTKANYLYKGEGFFVLDHKLTDQERRRWTATGRITSDAEKKETHRGDNASGPISRTQEVVSRF